MKREKLLVIVILIILSCLIFLVGCKKDNDESNAKINYKSLVKNKNGELALTLDNSTTSFKFFEEIVTDYTYTISTDIEGNNVLNSKQSSLCEGENIFFVTFFLNGEVLENNKIVIYRKHLYNIYFEYYEEPIKVEENEFVTPVELPKVKYYQSNYWDFDFSKPITENSTIYLNKTPIEYPISIDLNGGTCSSPLLTSVNITNCATTMERPTKKGYAFKGFKYPDGTIKYGSLFTYAQEPPVDVEGESLFKNSKTLFLLSKNNNEIVAQWEPIDWKLIYHTKWAYETCPEIEYGKQYSYTVEDDFVLPIPERKGYEFTGWKRSNDELIYWSIPAGTTGYMYLSSTWKLVEYDISWDLQGGVLDKMTSNPLTYSKETDSSSFSIYAPQKEGYTFTGYIEPSLYQIPTRLDELDNAEFSWLWNNDSFPATNLHFTAVYEPIEYNITYNLDEGTNNSANPKTYTIEQEVRLQDPERKGYEFSGWTDNGLISKGSIGEKTFTASWEIVNYHITYDLENGTNNSSNPTTYNVNTPTITLKAPTKLGYKFIEWSNGGVIESGSIGVKLFTAKWEIETYTITYDLNEGTNNKNNPDTYTVHDNITLAEPTRDGYTFIGWSNDGKIAVNSTGNKSFTASWEIIDYKITYVLNGGTNSESNKDSYNVADDEITLAAPTRAGYTFNGWSNDGKISAHSIGNKEFIASWTPEVYTITYDCGAGDAMEPQTFTVESEKIVLSDATYINADFVEWQCEGKKITEIPSGTCGNKELTAIWHEYDVKLSLNDDGKTYSVIGLSNTGKSKSAIDLTDCSKTITKIADSAFYTATFTSITLPDTIEYIGNYCFHYANSLKTVNLPKCLKYIGKGTFPCDGITINYAGTAAEWASIEKDSDWNYNNSKKVILNYLG